MAELHGNGNGDAPGSGSGAARPKSIVLFSDGTGNSSAKLFKTNVWRMYEAVDLDDGVAGTEQIVHYDEGVGNSGIRPLAALGAVFGIGLKRNVLDLYKFLSRNYRPGDRIYAFGFSRGAFTIRMLIGLINKEGVIPYRSEADLAHQAADAFRSYLRGRNPRFYPMRAVVPFWRMLVRGYLWLWRKVWRQRHYDREANHRPEVRFVGVWDTVAAYGGPITEIVRGFDDWIRPLTFKDRKLPEIVEVARHALALDDERDAFQPLPWDEPPDTDRDRLQQVWFAGMHADVGGGYPDDSLAYVSLAWMMEEAAAAGLKLRADKQAEVERVANAYGPIHDSRSGLGSYYRYQPRTLGAYIEPPAPGTQSMRDPEFKDQGIGHRPWVHESVLCRIHQGTDGYAPITLPGQIKVVGRSGPRNALPGDLQDRLDRTGQARDDRQESIRDLVWWRRLFYFLIVAATIALVALPLLPEDRVDPLCGDSRCYLGTAYGWLRWALPDFTEPWVAAFQRFAGLTAALIVGIILLRVSGAATERWLRDRTRLLWRQSLAGNVTVGYVRSPIRPIRLSAPYQAAVKAIKWLVLPTIFGLGMLLLLIWLAFIIIGQIRLATGENGDMFCSGRQPAAPAFSTADPCTPLGVTVRQGRTYQVDLHVRRPWSDGGTPVTPLGVDAFDMGLPGIVGAPFRRVVAAAYMQPLIEIERTDSRSFLDRYRRVHIRKLDFTPTPAGHYRATFTAPRTGTLSVFVNEAVLPFLPPDHFYRGSPATRNSGTACVAVTLLDIGGRRSLTTCDAPTKPRA